MIKKYLLDSFANAIPLKPACPAGTVRLWRKGAAALLLILTIFTCQALAAKNDFPQYKEIQQNVNFWKDVYAKYSSSQGILHDRKNLSLVYTTVNLIRWDLPGADKVNKNIVDAAKQNIQNILDELGKGKQPRSAEEKRIASLFPQRSPAAYRAAKDNIRLQIGQKDRFHAGVIRSGRYIKHIKDIFKAHNLPEELAYLPHVESSFNPLASSKAAACGLWQFTKGTGKNYLTINAAVDERLDPYISTTAAALLLKENYAQLGKWPLAITAYNYGRAGMLRAVKEQKSYPKIFLHYNKGYFKFASRNFYSEFLAAIEVARKMERDPAIIIDKPEPTLAVTLPGYTSCGRMQSFFKVSKADFTRLNPALSDQVLKGNLHIPKGYLLRLPGTKAVRLKIPQLKKSMFSTRQIPGSYHVVRQGETATSIAKKHHTSVKTINRLNKLNKNSTIKVGQKLKVPYNKGKIPILKTKAKRAP